MKNSKLPKLDERKLSDLTDLLEKRVPHYTPEWSASDEKDPGIALLKIFSHITETVIHRFNQVPRKSSIAFLDMLGIKLLPAQSSRVPLTFKLAEGTEKEIFIPARTQAATDKTEEHEELPFETEKNLLAIPSQLKKVVSIDPKADAIYLPPPSFLNGEPKRETKLTYKIVASSLAGSDSLQLDHVADLKEGDFLKIGEEGNIEYVVIASITGNIATITDKLLHTFPVNTMVEKITNFTLFEGKNMQEHSLYIGHKDFFNVKSTARFILSISHYGAEAGVTPLKASWEYWGEMEGVEGEGWRKFQVIDETRGLSVSGDIELAKFAEGEIKEKKFNDIKSRWIRCRLEEPLGVDVPRKLPVLDNIVFRVRSAGNNLPPDQAFNNEIPLDVTKPFTPFGKEPRMFESFSMANKDAFSKKGAKITLDFEVDSNIGSPCAVIHNEIILVFARGSCGRLLEIQVDPEGSNGYVWKDEHGFPPGTKIALDAQPSAISSNAKNPPEISVFVRTESGHLVERCIERVYDGTPWKWLDHGIPEKGIVVTSDPAIIEKGSAVSVFVTGSNGKLYQFYRIALEDPGVWIDHGKPDNTLIDSSPCADSYESTRVKIFVKGFDGQLYELDSKMGENSSDDWKTDYGSPSSSINVDSRPFAKIYSYMDPYDDVNDLFDTKVYVKGSDGKLWEYDTRNKWVDRELPIDSDPHGHIFHFDPGGGTSDKIHIFARNIEGNLVEWYKNGDTSGNKNHKTPANSKLFFSPCVLNVADYGLRVFSASSNNSIIKRNVPSRIWNEYKDPNETTLTPTLSWEYWNQKGWVVLKGLRDETTNLLKSGKITFDLPDDIEEAEVAGQKSYWIRARIVGGDYGKETFALAKKLSPYFHAIAKTEVTQQLVSTKTTIRPPIVNSLAISYKLETKKWPHKTLAHNNLGYIDQTEASKTLGKHFAPFEQLDERDKTLYLGFERSFKGGPVKIFFAARELPFTEAKKPKLQWLYSQENIWGELSHLDATEGLIKADMLDLIAPSDFAARSGFGQYLYWVKGSLAKGEYEQSPLLDGIYPNTTWAIQAETIRDEILGSSDAEPDQTFSFLKFPVLKGEEIRVREPLSEEEKQALIELLGEDAIYEVKDERGKVTQTWVLYSEVPDFFDSTQKSRQYTLDRATGELRFGDGIKGMIPPAGDDNIKAFFYQSGGGAQGNVKAGEIKTLKSAVGGVDKVLNNSAADGGADTATVDQMLKIGPAMISHRNRAVTAEDFEWLAREASRKVARARCLPNTNNQNAREAGWVTVVIVPDSLEGKPMPSLELKRKVRKYLEARCANTLAHRQHLHVKGPSYVEIGTLADVYVTSMDVATEAECRVRSALDAFFHPLSGGPEGEGWEFGRNVTASDIYALLEPIEGVDHVGNVRFSCNGTTDEEIVEIHEDFLVANGKHEINIEIRKGG